MRFQARHVLAALFAISLGCGGGGENPYALKKPSKGLNDLKQSTAEISPEEAEKKRKELGIKTNEEIAAENAAMFDKGAREYVKTRLEEYKAFIKELREHLDALEKDAPKWAEAKDPQAAFDKFTEGNKEWSKDFKKTYDTLTGHGAEGGNTQATFGKAMRGWEELEGALGPEIGKNEQFAATLGEIRKGLDETEKALEDIEKDESLTIDETYKKTDGKKKKKK
jgi:hypothetical protein